MRSIFGLIPQLNFEKKPDLTGKGCPGNTARTCIIGRRYGERANEHYGAREGEAKRKRALTILFDLSSCCCCCCYSSCCCSCTSRIKYVVVGKGGVITGKVVSMWRRCSRVRPVCMCLLCVYFEHFR